jgi:hypothetical protein
VAGFNISHVIVALTNLAYVALAIWLARKEFIVYAWILALVASVSTVYHLYPNSESLLYFDVAVALLSGIICILNFLPYVKPTFLFVFTVGLVTTGTLLWWESGEDRECSKYIWYHSTWHVITALALFLVIQCTDLENGKDVKPYPLLTGGRPNNLA